MDDDGGCVVEHGLVLVRLLDVRLRHLHGLALLVGLVLLQKWLQVLTCRSTCGQRSKPAGLIYSFLGDNFYITAFIRTVMFQRGTLCRGIFYVMCTA